MRLGSLLEELESRILDATGALAAFVSEINSSTAELRLRFFSVMDLGTLLRSLTNLRTILRSYGLAARKPRLEAVHDMLELVVEVIPAKATDLNYM